jgi:subtilisin family serine protease
MIKKYLILIMLLFIFGCNENHKVNSNKHYDNFNISAKKEPYFYQQWYIEYNKTFYEQNGINPDANIHPGNVLKTYSGKGVKIAIIDDGLDVNHEDLKGAVIKTYNLNTKTANVLHTDKKDYHGTAVTGIIGARVNGKGIKGIANKANIIFIKFGESVSDSDIIEAFNKAEEFGADIINCSWGTYDVSDAVKEKIEDLAKNGRNGKGIIIVFAAGNDSKDMGNDESSIPEVIAVGSTNKNNLRSWYSNYGKNLDILAPGGYDIGITTLDDMNDSGIACIDENYLLYNDPNAFVGTSASAPIVTASIALLLQKDSNLTRNDIENILKTTSDKIGNIPYNNGRNDYYGYGKINLYKMINFKKE